MADERHIIWTAACTADNLYMRVTLDTAGLAHALDGHPEIAPHIENARLAIVTPSAIHQSATRKNSLLFLNYNVKNDDDEVLTVPVLVKSFEGIVTSIHFRPANYSGALLWKP